MKPLESNTNSRKTGKEVDKEEERTSLLLPASEKVVFRKWIYPHELSPLENLYQKLKEERKIYRKIKLKPIR